METKNLNESGVISTLQDTEYILVTMADGSVGRIKKSDLMPIVTSAIPGLMPSSLFQRFSVSQGSSSGYVQLLKVKMGASTWGNVAFAIMPNKYTNQTVHLTLVSIYKRISDTSYINILCRSMGDNYEDSETGLWVAYEDGYAYIYASNRPYTSAPQRTVLIAEGDVDITQVNVSKLPAGAAKIGRTIL